MIVLTVHKINFFFLYAGSSIVLKLNNERRAETKADRELQPIDTTSSQHSSKPIVTCRFLSFV